MYRGLTKGISTNFIAFPTGFIYFAVYDSLKHYLEALSPKQSHHTMAHLLAGTVAEVSSIIIRNPFEVVKQQMQVSQESKLFQTFAQIYKTRGFIGYYAGFQSYVIREAPFSAIQMPVYELLRRYTLSGGKSYENLSLFENARNGALSGILASYLTNPLDVIKTRLMIDTQEIPKSMLKTGSDIFRQQGIAGFFKGSIVRMIYMASASIMFFCLFEPLKRDFVRHGIF